MQQTPDRRPKVIVLDLEDDREAIEVAEALANKTGSKITVQTSDGIEIETVGPTEH